jgi:hypothetical protein
MDMHRAFVVAAFYPGVELRDPGWVPVSLAGSGLNFSAVRVCALAIAGGDDRCAADPGGPGAGGGGERDRGTSGIWILADDGAADGFGEEEDTNCTNLHEMRTAEQIKFFTDSPEPGEPGCLCSHWPCRIETLGLLSLKI